MYAQIAVNRPLNQTFDYHIPPDLDGQLQPGHLVEVGFATAKEYGVVMALSDSSAIVETKPVLGRLDPVPVLNLMQIALAEWISATYLAPIGMCVWLFLPPGVGVGRDVRFTLLNESAAGKDATENALLDLLRKRGALTGTQIDRALARKSWRASATALVNDRVLQREAILKPPRVRAQTVETARLAVHPDAIDDLVAQLGKTEKRAERFKHILTLLGRENDAVDISWIYAQVDATVQTVRSDLKELEEAELITQAAKETWRDSLAARDFVPDIPPTLTPEQQLVWDRLRAVIDGKIPTPTRLTSAGSNIPTSRQSSPHRIRGGDRGVGTDLPDVGTHAGNADTHFLLHGVTGSGKTEIYLRAIEQTLIHGRDAIFLVPEIALTAQTVRRVMARFAGRVALVHSELSDGERFDTWRRAREGLVQVIVGTRSALFTSLPDVGLVILDEEHDHSYKQSPPIMPPYYHAREVAAEMMSRENGVLLLGSATPDLESTYRASIDAFERLTLPSRIMGHRVRIGEQAEREGVLPRYATTEADDALMIGLPPVTVVDMRRELKAGNTGMFSRQLSAVLAATLARQEQAILFLNRRGQATYVFCRDCGYVADCPRCDAPLTYHRHGERLRCHRCGYQIPEPERCPECGSKRIKFFGAGTQQVEQTVHETFPHARTLRWDADTARSPGSHEVILQRFIDRKVDVLIGTQMVAKGLDLPMVTLVGVISADMGLALPDFRAGERTFQLLTQVAGRAGRGLLGGEVVLQTYQPGHYAIIAASHHDYHGFYGQEIAHRRDLGYPPFRRMVRVLFRSTSEAQAQAEADRAAGILRHRLQMFNLSATEIIGPAPCFFTKVDRHYRWHLLLRGPDPTVALRDMDIPKGWFVDVDPVDIL